MEKPCPYWSDCGMADGGCCALSRFGGKPSRGACQVCVSRGEDRPMGAGDTVARVLNATGAAPVAKRVIAAVTGRPCRCARRQAAMNWLLPYQQR